ncbi:type VII secretion protein EssC [Paenibacillus sp. CAA11]|uniref:type VII secretion protein EssC n=1 Tax=Paenibacillus sp. CAA11 TaxID=1532905 RepID=UPI000D39A5B6|nr:type VII secretion protein EssC [Paenibacillus sp. CAA11]AWB44411.1 type VII secretion protein EssC [Paenibacillus sp. CAA11]
MSHIFQRSPRIRGQIKEKALLVPEPPQMMPRPRISAASYAAPSVLVLIGAGLWGVGQIGKPLFWNQQGLGVTLFCLGLIFVIGLPFVKLRRQNRLYLEDAEHRERTYLDNLKQLEDELQRYQEEQLASLLEVHADPERCMAVVRRRSPSLWERSTQDDDYLHIRLGTGSITSASKLILPKGPWSNETLRKQVEDMAASYETISPAPIAVPIKQAGVIGIVGSRADVLQMVRSMLIQLTTRHAPDEVELSVFFTKSEREEWSWMRWLPHIWDAKQDHRRIADEDQLDALAEDLCRQLASSEPNRKAVDRVVVISEAKALQSDLLYRLLIDNAEHGRVIPVVLADAVDKLPRECGLILECAEGMETYTFKRSGAGIEVGSFRMDEVTSEQADRFARVMAPIRLKRSDEAELPGFLTLFDLLKAGRVEELKSVERWQHNRYPTRLPVTLGYRKGGKPFVLNLHDRLDAEGHGPHGLIAGTTGSGKSGLLQSLVAVIAANYHPHDAAFLMIDYKGGGMSGPLRHLPHVIGSLTNLDGRMVARAKTALRAELIRRQKLLQEAGYFEHIDDYYQSGAALGPLPHLFVIVDEFAELKRDYPDFIDELVSVASIGRTLGLHLILSTQKPAGVVDDKIWSNARFRICLRVEEEADSRDMLKAPHAAHITIPGRGYVQIGSGALEEVQFAWSGAKCPEISLQGQAEWTLYRVLLSGEREPWTLPNKETASAEAGSQQMIRQVEAVALYVSNLAEQEEVHRLEGLWLPPLPERISPSQMESVPPASGLSACVGLVDNPAGQRRFPLEVALDQGNFALYGIPGSGKTTFVQSMLMSLSSRYSRGEWCGYVIDMGRNLDNYADLPQIADLLTPDDEERLSRLFKFLKRTVEQRKQQWTSAGVKTLEAYRESTGKLLPYLLVIIDDYYAFRSRHPQLQEPLDELLREGMGSGIRFVLTASRLADISEKTRTGISDACALALADPGDYYHIVGTVVKPGETVRGRGLIKGLPPLEFQTVLPVDEDGTSDTLASLQAAIAKLQEQWEGPKYNRIPTLPDKIALRSLMPIGEMPDVRPQEVPVPLGLYTEDLSPFYFQLDNGPHFVVGAPMAGGKTSFLQSVILSLAWRISPDRLRIFTLDSRERGAGSEGLGLLTGLPHVTASASGPGGAAELITRLEEELRTAADQEPSRIHLLVIDDADLLAKRLQDFAVKDRLAALLRESRERGLYSVLSGIPRDFPTFGVDWFTEAMACQAGFLLGTRDPADLSVFRIPITESSAGSGELPVLEPGQGYYVDRRLERIKTACPFDRIWTPDMWMTKIRDHWTVTVQKEVTEC